MEHNLRANPGISAFAVTDGCVITIWKQYLRMEKLNPGLLLTQSYCHEKPIFTSIFGVYSPRLIQVLYNCSQ